MSWRTNKLVLFARNTGRKLGVNSQIASFLNGPGYEQAYDKKLSNLIREGDHLWDVGANVGYYTEIFAKRVGDSGHISAFEPSTINFEKLTQTTHGRSNVTRYNVGLGLQNGTVAFKQGVDDIGATSRVVLQSEGTIQVTIRSAADLIACGEVKQPNVIKIDVEGFELEVLQGLGTKIEEKSLRVLGIEVHFGILKERGVPNAPEAIEVLLKKSGFNVLWPDNSHIIAERWNG